MIEFHVYDTSAILERYDNLFDDPDEQILIPITVLEELDSLKQKPNGYKTRKLIKLLNDNKSKYGVIFDKKKCHKYILKFLPVDTITNDLEILGFAILFDKDFCPDRTVFVTNDLALANMANLYFGEDSIIQYKRPEPEKYNGIEEVEVNDTSLAYFYSHLDSNIFELQTNQYLILKNLEDGSVIDKYCWTGETHRPVKYKPFESKLLGTLKPKKNDPYQALAFDSVSHNKITLLRGPSGTGKSTIAINYLISLLEKHDIDKIIIFCNPIATMNSAHLGFYPGNKDDKLLDSQIGNFLYSKFGGEQPILKLIEEEKLILLPMSDIRGYDTSGLRAGVYITEAQNMDIPLIKLALQRVGDDSIVILDGDSETQVDSEAFAGEKNGLKRVSEIFKGEDVYGEVELQNIHRSQIARIAQRL